MRRLLAVGLAVVACACGDAIGPTTVTITLQQALNIRQTILESSRIAVNGQHLPVTVLCFRSGGTVIVSGSISIVDGRIAGGDMTEEFGACVSGDLMLTGELKYSGTFETSQDVETLRGTLTLSGQQSGTCGVDVTYTSYLPPQQPFMTAWSGTICDIDVSQAAQGSTP